MKLCIMDRIRIKGTIVEEQKGRIHWFNKHPESKYVGIPKEWYNNLNHTEDLIRFRLGE